MATADKWVWDKLAREAAYREGFEAAVAGLPQKFEPITFPPLSMQIPFKRLHPAAPAPHRAHETDAGADLYALGDSTAQNYGPLVPGERRLFRTGIALALPAGYYGRIAPRSGLAVREGLDVMAGVVDSSYRGEVQVLLVNLGPNAVWIEPGSRIAQLIVEKCEPATFHEVEVLDETERAAGGFGSTGAG